MAKKSRSELETEADQLSSGTNSTHGGPAAIKGFLIQSFAALGKILTSDPTFEEITLEPQRDENGTVDKFDFIWKAGGIAFAAQVKSSENGFIRSDVSRWTMEMKAQFRQHQCLLVLAGHAADERRNPKLKNGDLINEVAIQFITSDLNELTKIACHDLATFLKDQSLNIRESEERFDRVNSLITEILNASTQSRTMKRDEFREKLREWSKTPKQRARAQEIELAVAYAEVKKKLNQLLAGHPCVGDFLQKADKELVYRKNAEQAWQIAPKVEGCSFNPVAALKAIKAELPLFNGHPGDLKCLMEVIGGIMTLSVDRNWVLNQRYAWEQTLATFPGSKDVITFKQGNSANLLSVLTAALSNGFVNLDRLFEAVNPKHVTKDPPAVFRGTLSSDKKREFMNFLVEVILGPVDYNTSLLTEVEEQFGFATSAAAYAAKEEGDPFFTTSESYQQLASKIKDLGLDQLLVMTTDPSSKLKDVIPDPVFFFSHAFEIFQMIKSKR